MVVEQEMAVMVVQEQQEQLIQAEEVDQVQVGMEQVVLAAQESLGNFFGSISLVADRPFKVGDWIQVGSKVDGDVEEIGLRSTKVRTWAKSQLTIPNKVLAGEIIENCSRDPPCRNSTS